MGNCTPILMIIIFVVVFLHDIVASPTEVRCWKKKTGPAWAGVIVDWLSSNLDCRFGMLAPNACWAYLCVLPVFWGIMVASSVRIRALTQRGTICNLHKKCFENTNEAWKARLTKDARQSIIRHIGWLCLFQLVVCAFDKFVFVRSFRWIVAYQVIWLGFAASIVNVMPFIKYCVHLSSSMIDNYITRMMRLRDEGAISWKQLAEDHRTLECDLCDLWIHLNCLTLVPLAPFFAMAALHFFSDENFMKSCIVASCLIIFGSLVVINRLSSIAGLSSMCNSGVAFKGKERQGQHSKMSIRAVARSYINEFQDAGSLNKPRNAKGEVEDKMEYMVFLEYLDNHDVTVHIGIPGVCMVGITRDFLAQTIFGIVVKLPLVVSWLVACKGSFLKK